MTFLRRITQLLAIHATLLFLPMIAHASDWSNLSDTSFRWPKPRFSPGRSNQLILEYNETCTCRTGSRRIAHTMQSSLRTRRCILGPTGLWQTAARTQGYSHMHPLSPAVDCTCTDCLCIHISVLPSNTSISRGQK